MARLFQSDSIGAEIYVFSDDHCPQHVHVRHRGDGWVARIRFSYVTGVVALMSIAPMKNIPLQRVVNQLLDDVAAHLALCPRSWWEIRKTACLVNQWAIMRQSGKLFISSADANGAKQIAAATYDPDSARLSVVFRDGEILALET
jgi:hypothetical protein